MEQITWSHSRLDAHNRCPRRWYENYIAKTVAVDVEPLVRGREVHQALRAYGKHCYDRKLPDDPNTITGFASLITSEDGQEAFLRWAKHHTWDFKDLYGTTEDPFELKMTVDLSNGDRFTGYLDFVRILPLYADGGLLAIYLDYKSGRSGQNAPPVPPAQLLRYAFLISRSLPDIEEVHVQQEFIGDGTIWPDLYVSDESRWNLTRHECMGIEAEILSAIGDIRAAITRYDTMLDDGVEQEKAVSLNFRTEAGEQCAGCGYVHVCPASRLKDAVIYTADGQMTMAEADACALLEVQDWQRAQANMAAKEVRKRAKESVTPIVGPDGKTHDWYGRPDTYVVKDVEGFCAALVESKKDPGKALGFKAGMKTDAKRRYYEDDRYTKFIKPEPRSPKWKAKLIKPIDTDEEE